MKTVAGKNACLVDLHSVDSIRHGSLHLINDNKYRILVALAGIENAKIYTPKSITNMYKKYINSHVLYSNLNRLILLQQMAFYAKRRFAR